VIKGGVHAIVPITPEPERRPRRPDNPPVLQHRRTGPG
jgi:hypothetical protein